MSEETSRKPVPQTKESAQIVLNRFLKENNILIGTQRPIVDFTENGQMIVNAPVIIAVYDQEPNNVKEVN